MKTKTVSYRRIKNLGHYQSETVEVMAEVEDGENWLDVFSQLKIGVLKALVLPEELAFFGPISRHPSETTIPLLLTMMMMTTIPLLLTMMMMTNTNKF